MDEGGIPGPSEGPAENDASTSVDAAESMNPAAESMNPAAESMESEPLFSYQTTTDFQFGPDNCLDVVNVWNQKFKNGTLQMDDFKKYWISGVPETINPPSSDTNENFIDWIIDETKVQNYLLKPLELFICNGTADDLDKLISHVYPPPSFCGRIFKQGEPNYSCRECSLDATCVLCVSCFKKSIHINHKYKMGTSIGGGCCDCGDIEAWKDGVFCEVHEKGRVAQSERPVTDASGESSETPTQTEQTVQLDEVRERCKFAFTAILTYAYKLLSLEYTGSVPLFLMKSDGFQDEFCTVLYNDETHTFEQVITTLTRVIKCSQRQSIEYVTKIDKEGRAVVKRCTFSHCNDLKMEIERYTSRHGNKPLKALVMHASVVAHQVFALRMLAWLPTLLARWEQFRIIFASVMTTNRNIADDNQVLLEGIFLRDSSMWKSARAHWHDLVTAGMLWENDTKKTLGIFFTKHYGNIIKDFIRDDHDHSFSIASLSVQLFPTPGLSHYLIAHHDLLFVLLNTFYSECSRRCNKNGKLVFERNNPNTMFKRAMFILYDLQYCLTITPKEWTDELRSGVLQGFMIVLNLLDMIQGMDSVARQTGQHLEYEPEWESAFNLQLKLSSIITLLIDWLGSDKKVLMKSYAFTLRKLIDCKMTTDDSYGTDCTEVKELADHSATCFVYDVASLPNSIHLPLSRFLAGLHLHLDRYNLSFSSFQCLKPSPEQILEPVLRTQALIAQVHAGMWRRNGYALLNQLFFYHNVKCRTEMLDRDIALVQIAASLIESNEFLIHLINKFGLYAWAQEDYETNLVKNLEEENFRQKMYLIEEFLGFLIVIIGERYVPCIGKVTHEERIKKEIIQQLCVQSMSHSQLVKAIPEDMIDPLTLDRLIDEVTIFKKPANSTQGVHQLKPEYYNEYNVFYYHYTREELTRSEEVQRKRRKAQGELDCCPPPKLPELTESFHMLVNLLQCDVMIEIITKAVLERSLNLRVRSFSETQLYKVLYLIGYALQEQESKRYPFFKFTDCVAKKCDIVTLLEELLKSPRNESHKDLIAWTINKYKEVLSSNKKEKTGADDEQMEMASTSAEASQNDRKMRAKLAAERRARVMEEMKQARNKFMSDNKTLFEETSSELQNSSAANSTSMDVELTKTVCLGKNQSETTQDERHFTCILCQEDTTVSVDQPPLVLAAFVQHSSVLSTKRRTEPLEYCDELIYRLSANLSPAPHTSTCGHVMHSTCWARQVELNDVRESRRPYRMRNPSTYDVDLKEYLCPLCERLSNTAIPIVPALRTVQPKPLDCNLTYNDWLTAIVQASNNYLMQTIERIRSSHESTHLAESSAFDVSNGSKLVMQIFRTISQKFGLIDASSQAPVTLPSNVMDQAVVDEIRKLYSPRKLGEDSSSDTNDEYPLNFFDKPVVDEVQKLYPVRTKAFSREFKQAMASFNSVVWTRGKDILSKTRLPRDDDLGSPAWTWATCAYTIETIEVTLRELNKPLLGQYSLRHSELLVNLAKVSATTNQFEDTMCVRKYAWHVCIQLFFDNADDTDCILDWDSFGTLVPLVATMPLMWTNQQLDPLPAGTVLELYILKIIFACHMLKIILTNDFDVECTETVDAGDDSMDVDDEEIYEFTLTDKERDLIISVYKIAKGLENTERKLSAYKIWQFVRDGSIPFLRCCVLFFKHLTDVAPPLALTQIGGDTFDNMCNFLGLQEPYINDLFDSPMVTSVIKTWCLNAKVISLRTQSSDALEIPRVPMKTPRLVSLPSDYSDLINAVSVFTCPNSDKDDSRNPTMCLVCGEMLCSQSYCCQTDAFHEMSIGACAWHACVCGAGAGIFLRVRECEVLLLATPSRGCFLPAPYVDRYGETDQGLKRGDPLRLCEERYRKLHMMWLTHSLYEDIVRYLESSNSIMQWQHL